MPSTSRATTVSASRNVCVRVLDTLSSTNATPAERSVTESKRFTLITGRQLLSAPSRRQLPSLARSRACTPDRNLWSQHGSFETGRIFQRGPQNASPKSPPDLSAWNLHPKPKSFAPRSRRLRQSRDRNPLSFESRGRECRTRFRESAQSLDALSLRALASPA